MTTAVVIALYLICIALSSLAFNAVAKADAKYRETHPADADDFDNMPEDINLF